MKIVIDIPRKTYEHIRADGGHGYFNIYDEDNRIVTKAVFNGKKLPEHHGRLGDLDELYTEMNNGIKAGLYKDGYENYGHINNMDDCLECVEYADTIIEPS